jgi:hypothetical protein
MRFATEDEFVAFARPDGVVPATLQLTDPTVSTTPLDEKIAMAVELERLVRDGDPRIRQVESADYSDYVAEAAIASTLGVRATYARSGAYVSVEAIANDGKDDQTGWGLSAGRAPHELDVQKAANDAVSRATRMLGAVKPASMKCTAVFDPRTAATLLAIIGGSLSGEAVVRGRSFFANRIGEEVAAPLFTLLDDPTDPRHFSASTFDGEGLACRTKRDDRNWSVKGLRLRHGVGTSRGHQLHRQRGTRRHRRFTVGGMSRPAVAAGRARPGGDIFRVSVTASSLNRSRACTRGQSRFRGLLGGHHGTHDSRRPIVRAGA